MREREYLDTLCNTGDGVFIVDPNRHIIRWNKAAEKILKYPESEVLNRDCFRIIAGRIFPDRVFCSQNCKIHRNALKGTPQQNFDIKTQTSAGEPLWLNVTIISPPDAGDPFIAHILRDVTREKERALALEQFLADLGVSGTPSEELAAEMRGNKHSPAARSAVPEKPGAALSGREIEVLKLLAEGLSTKGLAQNLNISHFTARNHIQNILVKLDLHSKAQAVSYAFKRGIL